ncbi:MAG TPA: aminotransferase class IV [Oligoflexia bacterium]|nr:aminotransferase class IV [Oligoflexia bacterium]HMP48719.1 aminotransferase class IV [Oligoflexia bacterium]
MYSEELLFESIRVFDGHLERLDYHEARMNDARSYLFADFREIRLLDIISIPDKYTSGLNKCRIIYNRDIKLVEFEKYNKKQITTLGFVDGGDIEYPFKFLNRAALDNLLDIRPYGSDDIIITKNGLVTDSSYSNLAFYKEGQWYTPRLPLLFGTKRAFLLNSGILIERDIYVKDILQFEKVSLINALLNLGDIEIPVTSINT